MAETAVEELVRVAGRLQALLDGLDRPNFVIGGPVGRQWGEPRYTGDVDAVAFTDRNDETGFVATMLRHYPGRREHAASFASRRRVLPLTDTRESVGVDLALGAFKYDRHAAEAAVEVEYEPGSPVRVCSAEHRIVYKLLAGRDLDGHDVKGILIRQQGKLDFELIDRELEPLIKLRETPELWDRRHALRSRYL